MNSVTAGHFIVLEGIDGAGTTTHTGKLGSALKAHGIAVHKTHEPSGGPIGVLLRQILTKRVVGPGGAPSWDTMGLLFAADRLDHLRNEVMPRLEEGVTVLSDRYDHSTVAYQTVASRGAAGALDWLKDLNRFARRPDLTIVLDVPPTVAKERRRARAGDQDLYEDDAMQRELAGFYREIDQHFPGEKIVHVAADRALDDVAEDVVKHVLALREGA